MAYVRTALADGFEVQLSAGYYRSRAAIMALIGLALGSCLCCGPIGLAVVDVDVDAVGGLAFLLMLVGFIVLLVVPLMAVAIVVNANRLAARTHVRVEGGVLYIHDGRTLNLTDINRFALGRRHDGLLVLRGWPCWVAYDNGGHAYTLAEGVHPLFDGRRASAVLENISADLGKPYRNQVRVLDLGLSASNCYMPIAGMFLIASIASLLFESGAKFRFAAKQSLLHFAVTVAVGFVGGIVCVAGAFGLEAIGVTPAWVALPAMLTLLVVFVMNVVLRFYAMFRASKDPFWVMPWLSPITRRWSEEAQAAPRPVRF